MRRFLNIVSVELAKTRRSMLLPVIVVCPLFVNLLAFMLFNFKVKPEDADSDAWFTLWMTVSSIWGYFMLPLFIALVLALLSAIEHKNRTWQMMFSLPLTPSEMFHGKLVVGFILILISNICLIAICALGIGILGFLGYPLSDAMNFDVIRYLVFVTLGSVPIVIGQHAISWGFQNFIAPLVFGVVSTLGISMVGSSDYWIYYPWSYTLVALNGTADGIRFDAALASLAVGLVMLTVSFLLFRNRRDK